MGQTIAEAIWEEGRAKGLTEGLTKGLTEGHSKGLTEGRSEGELGMARRILRQLLEDHFGAVSETVLQRIENATDVDRLTAAARRVSRLAKPEDLQL
jgi:flagellar biosynthesis/type III secretory pathway protein FliH